MDALTIGPVKRCSSCRQDLPVTSFHRRRHYVRGGVRAACRACTSATARERRDDVGVKHDRQKEMVRARTRAAVARGALVPGRCADCGTTAVEAHHPNYDHVDAHLHVEWLCRLHHAARHGKHMWTRQLDLIMA
jgi:hypothetical protein